MGKGSRAPLERERELELIGVALAAAVDGRGTITVVEGPAGIGKTRLLAAARERARADGVRVLSARGSDLEREFRWGVVRQLFEPAVAPLADDAREELLSGSAQLATTVLQPGADARDADEGGVLHGLYWLCAGLAEPGPLLVCVDDAHWSDVPSLRFLAYLAHRIEGLPLALLVGSRPGEVPRDVELLARLGAETGATVVHPAPLSGSGAAELLAANLGQTPDATFVQACQAATQGNPFLLEEVARAARDERLTPDAGAAAAVADLGPRSVARAILRRARALAPGAVELARAVAVLGPDAEMRHAAALAGLDLQDAGEVADALVAAEILADARPLGFVHALTRAAISGDMTRAERAGWHASAARLLRDEGAAPERVAAHLLHTEPSGDPSAVDVLRAAARDAMAGGAPSAAATYLRRALAEPPGADDLADVLHGLGHAEAVDGLSGDYDEHLTRAMQTSRTPRQRAAVALDLARAHATVGDYARTGRICLEALGTLGEDDSPATASLEAELIQAALNDFSLAAEATPVRRRQLQRLREGEIDDPERLAALGLVLTGGAHPARIGGDIAARAARSGDLPDNSTQPGSIGQALLFAGRLQEAQAFYSHAQQEGQRRGATTWLGFSESFRSRITLELGDVRRAEEEADHALELFEGARHEPGLHQHVMHCVHLAFALLERGSHEEAQAVLDRRPVRPGEAATYGEAMRLAAYSRLALERRDAERALACALDCDVGPLHRCNPAILPWRSDAARALVALGRRDEAGDVAAEELSLARAFEVPHAISRALRAAAHAEEDLQRAKAILEEAIATVQDTPAGLELMHANVELGAVLRRAGQRNAAVDRLRVGLDLAHRGGASALAERAHGELLTAGARPRRAVLSGIDALTPSERRVADLAADGRTNQEIAQALFVTARTVEAHLTRAFRKLDIASRTELAGALER